MLGKLTRKYQLYKVKRLLKQQGFTAEEIERKLTIAKIRSHLSFFGHDTSNMTDEEVEQGVTELGKAIGKTGITCEQAYENLAAMGKVL